MHLTALCTYSIACCNNFAKTVWILVLIKGGCSLGSTQQCYLLRIFTNLVSEMLYTGGHSRWTFSADILDARYHKFHTTTKSKVFGQASVCRQPAWLSTPMRWRGTLGSIADEATSLKANPSVCVAFASAAVIWLDAIHVLALRVSRCLPGQFCDHGCLHMSFLLCQSDRPLCSWHLFHANGPL